MWNKDERQGKAEQAKGRVKQALGALTGDKRMKAEGALDETAGKAREAVGTVRRAAGALIEDAGKTLKR